MRYYPLLNEEQKALVEAAVDNDVSRLVEARKMSINARRIPHHMWDSLVSYIVKGTPTGGFLSAVLRNDLKEACARADGTNQHLIYDYVYVLWNYAPMNCWSGPKNAESWLDGGLYDFYARQYATAEEKSDG